jgi:hypothetical protein
MKTGFNKRLHRIANKSALPVSRSVMHKWKGENKMKRMSIFALAVVITCVIAATCLAKEPSEFVEEFFTQVKAGKVAAGYDILLSGSGIPAMKPQAVDMLKTQTASGLPMYGKVLGFERIREEKFGTSIVRLVYVLKSEKAPTIWEFYFYKPQTNWFLANVLFNDQFQLLDSKK